MRAAAAQEEAASICALRSADLPFSTLPRPLPFFFITITDTVTDIKGLCLIGVPISDTRMGYSRVQFENRVQNWYYMYVESCTYVGISLVLRTLDLQRHPAQLLPLCRGPGRGRQGPDRVHITTHPVCKSVSLRGWGRTVASHKSNWGRTAATDKKNLGGTVEERLEITQVHADCVLTTC